MKDPYAILEVNPRASAGVIKAAYQALMKEHHPDHKGDTDLAKQINAAYAIVSDNKKRAKFDRESKKVEGTIIGNYKVLEPIAEGGFGSTYKGEQLITGSPVCIKHCSMISAAHDEILIQEAKAIWDLRHYSLPVMRDMHRLDDGSLALIMSYISGPTLEQIIEKAGKLEAETVAWIAERILNALLYLHHHGVIHGDIKPQNVIIQPETHSVILLDFGLALVKPTGSTKSQGYTPIFASPEQIDGKTLLPASDYYSLGMLMVYALNGGKNVEKKLVPASAPDPFCDFIRRLTKQDVLARPQNDLFDEFLAIRQKSFGRTRSGLKDIPGF